MTCETCGRPKPSGLFQMAQAIFANVEPHLRADQREDVKDAIVGFFAGKPPEEPKREFDL